ncbi:hypothetical protein SPBR_00769 [Sporothrix brasiliensis 5110]|uniref:Major facilitator superfamily (MFS) profile domain-containing protein n=1 Tax=Sporothrix brasiliensis 5110 TaxID=1398154 RepID=A0A0C2J001_9PEZI|nr:uncharacterized protein SPBR_00769 [Sporothrix brasiliensis 5110]KIH90532.1 hypothetical protein SPBR_00769 [Sporothrix brasiliensis 5110]
MPSYGFDVLARRVRNIQQAPRAVLVSPHLLGTAFVFAFAGFPAVWIVPAAAMAVVVAASFACCESPRWLMMVDRYDDALAALVRLRGLPADHPRVRSEITATQDAVRAAHVDATSERARVGANLRRVQQCLVSYLLAQLSGASQITSYLVPIMTLMGVAGSTEDKLRLSGLYGVAKLASVLLASFCLVDTLGRRHSLFLGIALQIVSDVYIGVYLRYSQAGPVPRAASQAALGFLYIHGFGYCIGLFLLPYVFGAELWPDHLRTFGGALGQTFHWLFIYAMNYGLPSLLAETHNWGAFLFFAACCAVALVYVFFMVPETSELSTDEIDRLFQGPWFQAYKTSRLILDGVDSVDGARGVEGEEGEEKLEVGR